MMRVTQKILVLGSNKLARISAGAQATNATLTSGFAATLPPGGGQSYPGRRLVCYSPF